MKKIDLSDLKSFNKGIIPYLKLNIIIFISSILITALILRYHPQYALSHFKDLASSMSGIDSQYAILSFIKLFLSNLLVSVLAVVFAMIPFLFIPTQNCIYNGYVFGLLIAVAQLHKKNVFLLILLGIVPHGIFELPAMLYSFSIGMYICKNKTFSILGKKSSEIHFSEIKKAFIYVIIPLLFTAALIESFITPQLLTLIK